MKKTTKAKKTTKKKAAATRSKTPAMDDPSALPPLVHRKHIKLGDGKTVSRMAANVRESLATITKKSRTKKITLNTPAMLRRTLLPFDELYWQAAWKSIGFRAKIGIEVIAPTGVGKTTWCFDTMARFIKMGCYPIHIDCERKPADPKFIARLMDKDKKLAMEMLNAITFASADTLDECDDVIRQTVEELRERCDSDPETSGSPIVVFVDPWGALMTSKQAEGNSDYGAAKGPNAKKKKPKGTTEGSNLGHSQHAHGMKKWLPAFMEKYNCTVVLIQHQNTKINMGPASFMAPSESKNETHIGGRAFGTLCGYICTLVWCGDLKDKNRKVYGHKVRMTVTKNSYGPKHNTAEFEIYSDSYEDTPDTWSPGLSYANTTAAWFATNKYLGTTVTAEKYTSDALGVVAVSGVEFYEALQARPDLIDFIGTQLNIEGYAYEVKDKQPDDEIPTNN